MDDNPKAIHAAFRDLYDSLRNAFWNARDTAAELRIRTAFEQVSDVLSDLDAEDIASRTEEYEQVTKKIEAMNDDLEKLANEIATIVNDARVATNVVNGIAKVLNAAGGFLGK